MSETILSRDIALRIALAARMLPDTDVARLLKVLADAVGLPPTEASLSGLTVKQLLAAADGEFADIDREAAQVGAGPAERARRRAGGGPAADAAPAPRVRARGGGRRTGSEAMTRNTKSAPVATTRRADAHHRAFTTMSTPTMNLSDIDPSRIADACAAARPGADERILLGALKELFPQLEFRRVLVRGGWHRPGGVVDLDKQRVAESLREWAERESDGDVATLMDKFRGQQLFATCVAGSTHCLVASTGGRAAHFVQLEIEELQEVLDHYLNDPEWLPDSLEDFIDPLDCPRMEPEPVGDPRFVFRRLLPVDALTEALQDGNASQDRLMRCMRDWDESSAAKAQFSEHWVLAVREYFDQYGIPHTSARPVATDDRTLPKPAVGAVERGAALANRLHGFDHEAGYPMAWYFHLLAAPGAVMQIIPAVLEDHASTYDYIPPADLPVLHRWLDKPYALV